MLYYTCKGEELPNMKGDTTMANFCLFYDPVTEDRFVLETANEEIACKRVADYGDDYAYLGTTTEDDIDLFGWEVFTDEDYAEDEEEG